ncbi:MAG: hypothetical protein ACYCWE_00450 [Eubacteriales bacterium]
MDFRAISPSELESWTRLYGNVFGGDGSYFYSHFTNDPNADCGGTFLLPVSSAARFYNQSAVRYNGPIIRSEQYYRRWILKSDETHRALVRNGEIAACAVYNISEKVLELSEYTGDQTLLPPLLSSAAAENTAECASVPAVYAPEITDYSESFSLMARLNLPFTAGSRTIASSGDLSAALSDCVFFDVDGF